MDRVEKILAGIDLSTQTGLEIGALCNPIVSKSDGEIYYVDHATDVQLGANFHADPNVSIKDLVHVDYIWGDETLAEATKGKTFDFVIASHVIEHVPDLVGWLREVSEVLKPGGILGLAIPDKRFTFDINRTESTKGDVIDAYMRKLRKPSLKCLFDHKSTYVNIDRRLAWSGTWNGKHPDSEEAEAQAMEMCRAAAENGAYIDTHCWVVTPSSFVGILKTLINLNLIEYRVISYHDTEINTLEFFISLQKPKNGEVCSRDKLLESLQRTEKSNAPKNTVRYWLTWIFLTVGRKLMEAHRGHNWNHFGRPEPDIMPPKLVVTGNRFEMANKLSNYPPNIETNNYTIRSNLKARAYRAFYKWESKRSSPAADNYKPVVKKIFGPESGEIDGSVCVFSHFDRQGEIDPHVLYYLGVLKKIGFRIIVVSTSRSLDRASVERSRDSCEALYLKDNFGYDFGAWKAGMEVSGLRFDDVDFLLLANDSVYGPLTSLEAVFEKMRDGAYDMYGITDSLELRYHVQSYFMAFSKTVINGPVFQNYWASFRYLGSKRAVIWTGETGLSQALIQAGYKVGAYIEYMRVRREHPLDVSSVEFNRPFPGPINMCHALWKLILAEYACPFLKVNLVRDNPSAIPDIQTWEQMVSRISDYDPKLIRGHLSRM